MTKSNENLTKERKSFKEVLVENKGKILIVAGVIASAAAVYFVGKDIVNKKTVEETVDSISKAVGEPTVAEVAFTGIRANSYISLDNCERIDKVENILIEGGVLDLAEASINRKKDTLSRKLACHIGKQGNPDSDRIIEECKAGIESFNKMLDGCDFIRWCWKSDTIDELLEEE